MVNEFARAFEIARRSRDQLEVGHLDHLLFGLGPFAEWWLHEDVKQRIAKELDTPLSYPPLPQEPGSGCIALVQTTKDYYPALSEAIPFPFQWIEGMDDDDCLPEGLLREAEKVRDQLYVSGWGLRLPYPMHFASRLNADWSFASAWPTLAASLLVATAGGKPDPCTWASGTWRPGQGIGGVDGLPAKIRLAAKLGGRYFFVPAGQRQEAEAVADGLNINIETLQQGEPDPRKALRAYTLRLDVPPEAPETVSDFEDCCKWFNRRRHFQDDQTAQFYLSHLLPAITDKLVSQIPSGIDCPKNLVTVVSGWFPFVSLMLARALQVESCLLLHTADDKQTKKMQELRAILEQDRVLVRSRDIASDPDRIGPTLANALADYRKERPGGLAIDITSGTSLMRFFLCRAGTAGDCFVGVIGESRDGQWQAGKERLVVIPSA